MTARLATTALAICCLAGCRTPHFADAETADLPAEAAVAAPLASRFNDPNVLPASADQPGVDGTAPLPAPVLRAVRLTQTDSAEELPPSLPRPIPSSTLADFEQLALQFNPAVARAAADVRALEGKWLQAGLGPNPEVGYTGQQIGDDGRAGQQGAYVSQEFVTADKLELGRFAVSAEIAEARHRYDAARLRVLTDVRQGYYELLIARRQTALAGELRSAARDIAEKTRERQRAGFAKQADVLLAEAAQERLGLLADTAANDELAAWRGLSRLVGRGDDAPPLMPDETIDQELSAVAARGISRDEALARLTTAHPLLAAAAARIEHARRQVVLAGAQAHPNCNATLAVQFDDATNDTVASLQLGAPLTIFNRNQGAIQQAQAELAAAEAAAEQTELALLRDFEVVFVRYQNARLRAEVEADIRRKAEQSRKLIEQERVAAESFDWLKLLTAQEAAAQATIAYLDALRELWAAKAEIEGLLLKDSLKER